MPFGANPCKKYLCPFCFNEVKPCLFKSTTSILTSALQMRYKCVTKQKKFTSFSPALFSN